MVADDRWSQTSRELEAILSAYPALRPLVSDPETAQFDRDEVPVDVVLATLGLALAKVATAPIRSFHSGLDIKRIEALVSLLRSFEKDRIVLEHQLLVENDLQSALRADIEEEEQLDLEAYSRVKLADYAKSGTSSITKLIPEISRAKLRDHPVRMLDLVKAYKASEKAEERYVSTRTSDMPNLPLLRNEMGRHWLSLSPETQLNIVNDVRATLVFWKIARPAILSPCRPGIAQALTYGLQIPLKEKNEIPPSESGIEKSLNNLRSSWSWLLANDCGAAQWAAQYLLNLRPSGTHRKVIGDAIRAFASAETSWTAPSGRKSKSEFNVSKWRCDTCNSEFHPGDNTHDSPLAVKKRASGEEVRSIHAKPVGGSTRRQRDKYRLSHRMLAGLPSTAADWNRLMCAVRDSESGRPCWKRGGVLVPMPAE